MVYGGLSPIYYYERHDDMLNGKISNFNDGIGQILSEGKTYNFNLTVVQVNGNVKDGDEINFDVDHYNNVKTIVSSSGATTFAQPTPKTKKENKKSESTKVLLTEEK